MKIWNFIRILAAAAMVAFASATARAEHFTSLIVDNNCTLGSSAADVVTINGTLSATVLMENGESIVNSVNGTFDLTRNEAGTVTVTASDDDATAALAILPGGAAAFTLGGASCTSITLQTDGGSVVVDGTLNGVAPAGITADAVAGTWTFTRTAVGIVQIISADDDATADLTIDPGGSAILTLGTAGDTVTVAATSGITLGNSESLNTGVDATFDFTRNNTGTVTITSSDDDATAGLTILPGGAAALNLGGASTTNLQIDSDVGITFAKNQETLDNAVDGAFLFGRNDAGAVTITSADNDATAALTIDPGGTAILTLGSAADTVTVAATAGLALSQSETVSNATNGTITLSRNDAGTLTIIGADDAGVCDTIYDTTGAGTIQIGSADVTSITLSTDGAGTAEVALPAGSIDSTEILDGTIATVDISATAGIIGGQIADDTITADDLADALTPEAGSTIVGADTLGGNPTFAANAIGFGTTGIMFEGATGGAGNALEGLLTVVDPTVDRTWTLPDASGTVAVSATSPATLSAAGDIGIGADTIDATHLTDALTPEAGSSIVGADTLGGNPTFAANALGFGTTGLMFEGTTGGGADAFEGLLTVTDPTADRTWTLPNASGTVAVSATSPATLSAAGDIGIGADSVDATHLADALTPEAGSSIVGADTLVGDPTLAANAIGFGTTGLLFEGATGGGANALEGLLTVADPTVDRTWTLPDASGTVAVSATSPATLSAAGDVGIAADSIDATHLTDALTPEAGSSIVGADTIGGNPTLAANAIGFGTTGIIFEGATGGGADANETLLTAADPGADVTVTIPATTGTLVTTGDTASVTATMIANVVRSVVVPIAAVIDSTTGLPLDASVADAAPDFTNLGTGTWVIAWDDTGGSVDTNLIAFSVVVPADYISGGSFIVTLSQDVAIAVNIESFDLEVAVQVAGSAADVTYTANAATNLTNTVNVQTISFDRSAGLAVGNVINAICRQDNATPDDIVYLHGIEFQYTGSQ